MKKEKSFKMLRSARLTGWVVVASVTLNLLGVVAPLAILMIFERVIPHQSIGTLQMICAGLVGAAVFETLLKRARSSILVFTAGRSTATIQVAFLSRILKSNPRALRHDDPAVHLERYSAIEQLRDQYTGEGKTLFIDLPFCVLFIGIIGVIGGWLVLVP